MSAEAVCAFHEANAPGDYERWQEQLCESRGGVGACYCTRHSIERASRSAAPGIREFDAGDPAFAEAYRQAFADVLLHEKDHIRRTALGVAVERLRGRVHR